MSLQDSLAVSHVAAVGTEQALGCAVVLSDDVFSKSTLLTAHYSQALHAASAKRVSVHSGEMLRQLLEMKKRKVYQTSLRSIEPLFHISYSFVKMASCFPCAVSIFL